MLLRLLTSIDQNAFEPVVLSQYQDELCVRAADNDIRVEIIPFRGILDTYNKKLLFLSPVQILRLAFRIGQFNLFSRNLLCKADVVWCENLRALLTISPYTVFSRTPIVWNIGLGLKSTGKVQHLNSLALRLANHVFIESEDQARSVFTDRQYQRHEGMFTIFHKGIDIDRFDPTSTEVSEQDCLRIGTAAALTPRKGFEYFIDAAAQLVEKSDRDLEFLIAGSPATADDETYAQSLQERIEQHGITEAVQFLGWVDKMPEYLASLDIFVLASLNEGIPGTVREALAMECPVVATDVGGTKDAVINGETGLLVKPEDADALAAAIDELLSSSEYRRRMGTNGRKHIVEQFSMERYVSKYEQFLSKIAR